ncbi:MAG: HDOD domain-containing protein [Verrucomicrobia bacterium]|nr:HDOD domain-containing protein [Verrucomicrobiota bacterium]
MSLPAPTRLDFTQISAKLQSCPRLPSLGTINSALRDLLEADQSYTTQIAEVIRRDPSLTARLLRLVNSVYYGLNSKVRTLEEAVFYLGVRQIRQLAMVTPIIEDFQKLAGTALFPWREFWQHCIGTAILTREVTGPIQPPNDDADYVAGLTHDVGKIAMAAAFPEHFNEIYVQNSEGTGDLLALEKTVLGMDHAELGALYLSQQKLPEIVVETARLHHRPERADARCQPIVAAVQIADLLARHARIGTSGNRVEVTDDDWMNASGWKLLFPGADGQEAALTRAHLKRTMEQLPVILEGLV